MEKVDYKNLAAKLFCFAIFGVLGILFFKYLFAYIIPFLIAWGIAYVIYPLAVELSAKIKISRKVCSFLMVVILLTLILSLLFLIGNRLLYEIQNFVNYLTQNSESIAAYFKKAFDFVNSIGEKIPFLNNLQETGLIENLNENISQFISGIWQSVLDELGSVVPRLAADIVTTLPNILLVSLVTVISCFYFALDIDLLHLKLKQVLPSKVVEYVKKIKAKLSLGFRKYLKAYFLIFALTFAELFLGFLILGIDYSFVLAILIAFVDFLPVFGTGAILLPWGIVLIFMKNYFVGIGLLILLTIITVVRQVVEPKIVGKSLGVHPLLTLVAIYVGFKLFGLLGMILFPILIPLIFFKEEKKQEK